MATKKNGNGSLNELSLAIGNLQSDVRNTNNNLNLFIAYVKDHHQKLDAKIDPLVGIVDRVKDCEDGVSDYRAKKSWLYGIAAAFGLAGDQGSHLISKWFA